MALLRLHTSRISWFVPTEGYYDERGDWHEGEGHWEGDIPCEDVPSGGVMSQIVTEDGEVRYYSRTIYIKARHATHKFNFGDKVRVTYDNGEEKEFSVKGYSHRQLQTKLWL